MLTIDILTTFLICGVSSLAGAAILRLVQTDDLRLRRALDLCSWAMVAMGLGLLPAGLGPGAAHWAAQFSLAFGSHAAVVVLARGMAQVQGRDLPLPVVLGAIAALGVADGLAIAKDFRTLGDVYALGLAAVSGLLVWVGRGFLLSPRNLSERALGLSLALVLVSSAVRLGFTLADAGPARIDMLYAPPLVSATLGALYGVIPFVVATLLLSIVNSRLHQQLHRRATTDELTGVLTRRALRELVPPLLADRARDTRPLALMMIDLDHFKRVNDSLGHAEGDRVLVAVAAMLQAQLRPDALLARYGGEEFVAAVPVDSVAVAQRVSQRLRSAVETMAWGPEAGIATAVTVSVGVALAGPRESLDSVLQRADEALYRAKHDGRNQVRMSLGAA